MSAPKSSQPREERGPRPCFRKGPPVDETCSLTRVVEIEGRRLAIWTCTEPRPDVRVKFSAHRFPQRHARKWWPGCRSAWYDAHYREDESCIPGRTQFVVYAGGKRKSRH